MTSLKSGNNFNVAYDQGYEAYQHGLSKNSCLFLPGTNQHIAWNKGYDDAEDLDKDCTEDSRFGDFIVVGLLSVILLAALVLLFIIYQ